MDDGGGLGWIGWIVVGAAVGVAVGWERVVRPEAAARGSIGLRVLLALWWAGVVAIEAESVRGFLVMFLSSVGAYKLAALSSEFLVGWLRPARFPRR